MQVAQLRTQHGTLKDTDMCVIWLTLGTFRLDVGTLRIT